MPAQTVIQHRRDLAANWITADPILDSGEIGFETDTGKFKIGDGVLEWLELKYAGSGGAEISDTAPEDPDQGAFWFNSITGITSVYVDSAWIELSLTGNLDGGKANTNYGGISPILGGNAEL